MAVGGKKGDGLYGGQQNRKKKRKQTVSLKTVLSGHINAVTWENYTRV